MIDRLKRLALATLVVTAGACDADEARPRDDGRSDTADGASDVAETSGDTDGEDLEPTDTPPNDVAAGDGGDTGADPDGSADTAAGADAGPRACLGHPSLCDRPFDAVALPGTHNSYSARDDGFFAPNQEHGVARQLEDGVRAFMLDSQWWNDEVHFCHSDCRIGLIGAGEVLDAMRAFLAAHPDELIVVIFENRISGNETAELLREHGLDAMAITPPAESAPWPTVVELLDSGQRALFTLESGASDEAWLRNAWDVFSDTPYTFASVEELSCEVNRGDPDNGLFLVNHWLQDPISTPALAAVANDYDTLLARAEQCAAERGRIPNFVGVDFYDVGDLFAVVDTLNGVER